jgi:hypothetical protein
MIFWRMSTAHAHIIGGNSQISLDRLYGLIYGKVRKGEIQMAKGYYVTLKDGQRTAWLLGPFADHERARAAVRVAADEAERIDPRCFFYAHGTSSIESDRPLPPGKLNDRLAHLL